ncbi:hypothetical protein [Burkholderia multivorans]|nr:hypothetical protein [Burkholderia multivorans]
MVAKHRPVHAVVVARRLAGWVTETVAVAARAVTVLVLLLAVWVVGNE